MNPDAGIRTGEEEDLVRCVFSIEESLGAIINLLQPLEFLRFDGTGDPISWLISCEHYFCVR
jgi:hypothetical protein